MLLVDLLLAATGKKLRSRKKVDDVKEGWCKQTTEEKEEQLLLCVFKVKQS